MKALLCTQFGLHEALAVQEIPNPTVSPNQILIAVEACGVNFPDVLIIQNKYQFKPELPFAPGGEVAGKIIGLGEKVQGKVWTNRTLSELPEWLSNSLSIDQFKVNIPKGVKS